LRKENELLKLNLQVVLEKVRNQETELRGMRERADAVYDNRDRIQVANGLRWFADQRITTIRGDLFAREAVPAPDPVQEAEAALKALREAKDDEARRRATESLEKALQNIKHRSKDTRPAEGK
jgi:hypothetical protein